MVSPSLPPVMARLEVNMAKKTGYYITVARRKDWTLCYPRHLWEALTENEQQDVLTRQQALFDKMERKMAHRKRSKQEIVQNV